MIKALLRIVAVIIIVVVIFSPFLLVVDFNRYAPVVLLVWVLSIAYYVFSHQKKSRQDGRNIYPDDREKPKNEKDVI